MGSTTLTKPDAPPELDDLGPGGGGSGAGGFGGGDGEGGAPGAWALPARAYRTGIWVGLGGIVMLFAAFSSALVVRKGMGGDWVQTPLPGILWANTLILLASSVTLEVSRRSLRAGLAGRFTQWLYGTAGLGVAFLAGQLMAWRQLRLQGVYLGTNPSSSFFYVLTGAHGLHLLGGVLALFYLVARAGRIAGSRAPQPPVDVTAIYWHFMDGLWVYILLLLQARF